MSRDLRVNRFSTTAQGLVPAPGTSKGYFLTDSGGWSNLLTGSAGIAVQGPAATTLPAFTFGQTGQATWQLYLLASTNDAYLYNNSSGNLLKFFGNGAYVEEFLNSAGYTAAAFGVAGFIINNVNATAQSGIEFQLNGVVAGRVRSDYLGDMAYVATASGAHNFYVGGDATVGSVGMTLGTTGLVVGAPTGGFKGAGTINCQGLYVNGVAVTVP